MGASEISAQESSDEVRIPLEEVVSDFFSGQNFVDRESLARLDREFKAALSEAYGGQSPIEIGLAYLDWLSHLMISPGRQISLAQSFIRKCVHLGFFNFSSLLGVESQGPASGLEARVSGDAWKRWPFQVLAQLKDAGSSE